MRLLEAEIFSEVHLIRKESTADDQKDNLSNFYKKLITSKWRYCDGFVEW
jgi:hypothetical protein